MSSKYLSPPETLAAIGGYQKRALAIGLIGTGLSIAGYFIDPDQFYRSWLVAFVLWNGMAMGCLAINMLQHLTGGNWGVTVRRITEAGSRTFPLTLVMFIPVALGIKSLYIWARPEIVAKDHILQEKAAYLNPNGFLMRTALYFAIWFILSALLNKWSRQQDEQGAEPAHTRMQRLSGPGLILYMLTLTFSAVDWMMSLDPHWYSTIYGILFVGGQGIATFAFTILVLSLLRNQHPYSTFVMPKHLHDLGKLLFAFVMLWAYFNVSQLIIVWSANLPEEIVWYLKRYQGGWQYMSWGLILLHFAVPFSLLLSRRNKTIYRRASAIAIFLLFMRFCDMYFLAGPVAHGEEAAPLHVHWLDFTTWIGLGGLWVGYFFMQLKKLPLLPLQDPMLEEAVQHGRHH